MQGLGPGLDLVAEDPGGEDVELELDRREVVAGGNAAKGGPGCDGVAEGGPDAAVDEAAGMQVALVDTICPRAWESSTSSGSIARSPGKLPGRKLRTVSGVIIELGCGWSFISAAAYSSGASPKPSSP
jgi:hypothetical protein